MDSSRTSSLFAGEIEVIDTASQMKSFVEQLPKGQGMVPSIYFGILQNDGPGKAGAISIISIFIEPRKTAHIINVTGRKTGAFTTKDSKGRTLRTILESSEIVKVCFDIRDGAGSFLRQNGIQVHGVEEI